MRLLPQEKGFSCVLVRPYNINHLNYNDINYRDSLLNLDIYENISLSSDNFETELYNYMEMEKFDSVTINSMTLKCESNIFYEMIHLDLPLKYHPLEIYNGLGRLLSNEIFNIYGNIILIKTKYEGDNMEIIDFEKSDLDYILKSRVNKKAVVMEIDGEINEIEWGGDIDKELKKWFPDGKEFIEDIFLKHNLQIYYTRGENNILYDLIGVGVEELFITSKLTENIYDDFSIEEFNKIRKLLGKIDKITPEEWLKEERDENNRIKIINKYTILERALSSIG